MQLRMLGRGSTRAPLEYKVGALNAKPIQSLNVVLLCAVTLTHFHYTALHSLLSYLMERLNFAYLHINIIYAFISN